VLRAGARQDAREREARGSAERIGFERLRVDRVTVEHGAGHELAPRHHDTGNHEVPGDDLAGSGRDHEVVADVQAAAVDLEGGQIPALPGGQIEELVAAATRGRRQHRVCATRAAEARRDAPHARR
jgi:hypothetical protein